MHEADKQRVVERYNDRLRKYGADPRSLAGGTAERNRLRYQVLCEVGVRPETTVLDVGCGFAGLFDYLAEKMPGVHYSGCDINSNIIQIAREKHPGADLFVGDLQEMPADKRYDYVVSSSALNNPMQAVDQYDYVTDVLKHAYDVAEAGVAVDFMSSYVDYTTAEAFHYEPEKIFAIAKKISKRVCLRHDYPLFEFCIYIYKDFAGWRNAG